MKLLANRTAQRILAQEFVFTHNGWVVDSADGTKKTMGSTVAASTDPAEPALTGPVANTVTFDCLPMPVGAVIVGGELIVETAFVGPTAHTLSLGIAGTLTALLNAVSLLATGRTALNGLTASALNATILNPALRLGLQSTDTDVNLLANPRATIVVVGSYVCHGVGGCGGGRCCGDDDDLNDTLTRKRFSVTEVTGPAGGGNPASQAE